MIRPTRRYLFLVLVVMMSAGQMDGSAIAAETGKIVDVKISTDLHKVMIKTHGDIGRHSTLLLDKPPRLVVDFPSAGLDLSQGMKTEQREEGLVVRAAKTRSGVRVVLDFGRGRVPEHKIHRMGNDLILFLEDWTTPATAPDSSVQAEKPLSGPTDPPLAQRKSDPAPSGHSELEVKATQVSGGLIVLKVADRKEPGNIYRVELGLDLDRLGFTSARVIPLSGQRSSSGPPAAQPRVVSRERSAEPASNGHVNNLSVNPSVGKNASQVAPVNGPRSGPASTADISNPQGKANQTDQSLLVPTNNRMPRPQPVTESLRAKVYGQDPVEAAPSRWSSHPQGQEPRNASAGPLPADASRRSGTASIHRAVDRVLGY